MNPVHAPSATSILPQTAGAGRDERLLHAARELEATFLAEMLKSAGLGKTPDAFGGGAGEEQFGSFMRMEQARAMVASGGIGLAQSLFEALKERDHDAV